MAMGRSVCGLAKDDIMALGGSSTGASDSSKSPYAPERRSRNGVEFPWSRRAESSTDRYSKTEIAENDVLQGTLGLNRFMTFGRFIPPNQASSSPNGDAFGAPRSRRSSSSLDDVLDPSRCTNVPQLSTARESRSGAGLVAVPQQNEVQRITTIFGTLPDPIRLHEQLGEFDGQVVFIAHPNRDISAHQWSSKPFQWETIGRYVHARGKIEGSLASDRLKVSDVPLNSLQHFKLVAKAREQGALDHTRPKNECIVTKSPKQAMPPYRPISWAQSKAGPGTALPFVHNSDISRQVSPKRTERVKIHSTSATRFDVNDDPFVMDVSHDTPRENTINRFKTPLFPLKGSLDLQYKFPLRSAISPTVRTGSGTLSMPRKIPTLQAAMSEGQNLSQSRAPEKKDLSCYPHATPYESITYSRILHSEQSQPTARSLFPQPGLTVANPRRMIPQPPEHTNASAEDASEVSWLKTPGSDIGDCGASRKILYYSDPDPRRQVQSFEVVNGVGRHLPTPQNFRGPFFEQTQPTANDPTSSLSNHMSEKQKLGDWYWDGQRLARQRGYSRILMEAPEVNERGRNVGVIGETGAVSKHDQHKNTILFVRLHENLSEYVEECGTRSSYFTRAWKPATSNPLDSTPEGLNSYVAAPSSLSNMSEQRYPRVVFPQGQCKPWT